MDRAGSQALAFDGAEDEFLLSIDLGCLGSRDNVHVVPRSGFLGGDGGDQGGSEEQPSGAEACVRFNHGR